MLSFGQKMKLLKICEKLLFKHIRVVLCKKRPQKTANNSKNESILKMAKNGHNPNAIASPCKLLTLGQKTKLTQTCEKGFYKNIRVVLCQKNGSKKQPVFRKIRAF